MQVAGFTIDSKFRCIVACIAACVCCIGTIFLIAAFFISVLAIPTIESGSVRIGDVLGNSSALFQVNSPAVAMVQFEIGQDNTIFRASHVPPIITENLPLRRLIASSGLSYKGGLNYLGSYNPIYLLAGSSIQYNAIVYFIERTDSACLYLFTNGVYFNNFINSNMNGQETASYCFVLNFTQISHSFEINTDGVYYVAVEIRSGFVLQANVFVVRKSYDTTGLEQNCNHARTCNVTVCGSTCTDESTTYFLIQPTNTIDMNYTFSGPRLHGSTYAGLIATTVLGIYFCCSCFCLCIGVIVGPGNFCKDYKNTDNSQPVALHLSRVVNTQEERNTNPSLPSVVPIKAERNTHPSLPSLVPIKAERNTNPSLPSVVPIKAERNTHPSLPSVVPIKAERNTNPSLPSVVPIKAERNTYPSLPSVVPIKAERNTNPSLPSLVPIKAERNTNPSLPSVVPIKVENNQKKLNEDVDPPKYFNREGNTTNSVKKQGKQ